MYFKEFIHLIKIALGKSRTHSEYHKSVADEKSYLEMVEMYVHDLTMTKNKEGKSFIISS